MSGGMKLLNRSSKIRAYMSERSFGGDWRQVKLLSEISIDNSESDEEYGR